jgi:hypothetical protein
LTELVLHAVEYSRCKQGSECRAEKTSTRNESYPQGQLVPLVPFRYKKYNTGEEGRFGKAKKEASDNNPSKTWIK